MPPRRYRMDKRVAAVGETRRRIVEATVALHAEQGVLATSWEDIARRADVAVATVYRHFPSLDELVLACGERVRALSRAPTPETASKIFAGVPSRTGRIERLVVELHAFYERGAPYIELALRERVHARALDASVRRREATLEALVRKALRPLKPHEQTIRLVCVLTDFPLWKSLVDRGIPRTVVANIATDLVLCALHKAARRKNPAERLEVPAPRAGTEN